MAEGVDSSNGETTLGLRDVFGRNTQSTVLQPDLDNTDESDYGEEIYTSDGSTSPSWISWFCSLKGHEYFCEVPEEFIIDEFNLTGLCPSVNYYTAALNMILDNEDTDEPLDPNIIEEIDSSAEIVYGLIHARYILIRNGLCQMADKYESGDFGKCPRYCCNDAHVVPCGRTDIPERDSVKLFCPSCLDIYSPPSSRYNNVDGAYFGTTFPHMFFQAFPSLIPLGPELLYTPRIYGFAINERSNAGPRMQWLRMRPKDDLELEGLETSSDGGESSSGSQSFKEAQDDPPAENRDENLASDAPERDGTSAAGPSASNRSAPSSQNPHDSRDENMDLGTDCHTVSRSSTPAAAADNLANKPNEDKFSSSAIIATSSLSLDSNEELQSQDRWRDNMSNSTVDHGVSLNLKTSTDSAPASSTIVV